MLFIDRLGKNDTNVVIALNYLQEVKANIIRTERTAALMIALLESKQTTPVDVKKEFSHSYITPSPHHKQLPRRGQPTIIEDADPNITDAPPSARYCKQTAKGKGGGHDSSSPSEDDRENYNTNNRGTGNNNK